jgi:hypothetical protein
MNDDFGRKAVWDFFDSIDPNSDIPEGACFGSPRLSICDGSANSETIIVTRAKDQGAGGASPPLTSSNSDVDY